MLDQKMPVNGIGYEMAAGSPLRAKQTTGRKSYKIQTNKTQPLMWRPLRPSMSGCALDKTSREKCYDVSTNSYVCPINECHKSLETDNQFRHHLLSVHSGRRFKCYHFGCDKDYKTKFALMTHQFTHRSDKQFKCHYNGCQYETKCAAYLSGHMKTHSTDREYRCAADGCGKVYKSWSGLDEHSRCHRADPSFRCRLDGCEEMFFSKFFRRKHQESVHNRLTSIERKYRFTRRTLATGGSVIVQMGSQSPIQSSSALPPDTDSSAGQLSSSVALDGQLLWQTISDLDDNRMVGSDIPPKSQTVAKQEKRKRETKTPKKTVVNNNTDNAIGGESNEVSDNESLLKEPKKKRRSPKKREPVTKDPKQTMAQFLGAHKTEREKYFDLTIYSFRCPIGECHKIIDTDNKFRLHLYSFHGERRFACDHNGCHKIYKTKYALEVHSTGHSGDKPYKCQHQDCRYEAKNNLYLLRHMKTHETSREYKCSFVGCDKTYKSYEGLEEHSRSHRSEPTYRCGVDGCEQMFFSKFFRRKHQTDAHNRAPFVPHKTRCEWPGSVCVRVARLWPQVSSHKTRCEWPGCEWEGKHITAHKLQHTGEKPFVCEWPDCGRRFRMQKLLKEHQNVHNNLKPYACHWPGCQYRAANSANVNKHMKQSHNRNSFS
ncbi:unnamed protein product [Medioppia subpectinata]|uniref:C2H2-type domain-containing protein n=1 Tax=Medioppia subpectinata TaxID=1979941 RepID=A0A7R9L835_9ACAR|nr:unnamed protein product [Medioppia subpectinata]CAG2116775.1 unnamed protein product [Medioppia subpectinata]